METSEYKRLWVVRTIKKKKKKKSSVKSVSGLDKRGLHSPGLQPNQTNKSIVQQPHPQTVHLPTRSSSAAFLCTAFPTRHGYQCVFHSGVQKLTARHPPTQGTVTLQNPQCNSGTMVFSSVLMLKNVNFLLATND